MTATFLIIAAILTVLAAALLALPLLRGRAGQPRAKYAALGALIVVGFGSTMLYSAWSKFNWDETPAVADTPAAMTARLARRLGEKPPSADDIDDWLKLGRSYEVLGQAPLAIRAYQRADRLANGTNVEAIFGVADLLLTQDPEEFRGPGGKLYERALELAPDSQKALFGAAMTALGRGETALGRERMERILTLHPPQQVREVVQKFITNLDSQAQAASATPGTAPGETAGETPADSPQISVRVTVAPALAAKIRPDATLFVAARDPKAPGPPFAAKRLAARFPVDVVLTPADAMMPARRIAAGQTYSVVARVALGGTPTASSGDPFGQVGYHVGKDGRLNIVIDQLSP